MKTNFFLMIILLLGLISCDFEKALNGEDDDKDRDHHSEYEDHDDDFIGPRTCIINFIADGTAQEAICIEANTGFESEDCQRVSTDILTSSTNSNRLSQFSITLSSITTCAPSLDLNDGTNTNTVNHSGFCSASYDAHSVKMYFYGTMVFGNTLNNQTDCSNIFSGSYTDP